jgi:integrase
VSAPQVDDERDDPDDGGDDGDERDRCLLDAQFDARGYRVRAMNIGGGGRRPARSVGANARAAWAPALAAAALPHRRIYDMRHTFAAWSLAAGMSIFTLSRRMGTGAESDEDGAA